MNLSSICRSGSGDARPYWINMGLFYPAILGALIYEIGPSLYSLPWTWGPARILVFVMLLHYALDYAYSADDRSKAEYCGASFPLISLSYGCFTPPCERRTQVFSNHPA